MSLSTEQRPFQTKGYAFISWLAGSDAFVEKNGFMQNRGNFGHSTVVHSTMNEAIHACADFIGDNPDEIAVAEIDLSRLHPQDILMRDPLSDQICFIGRHRYVVGSIPASAIKVIPSAQEVNFSPDISDDIDACIEIYSDIDESPSLKM